ANNTVRNSFVELYNDGATAANLTGWRLSGGVDYFFPAGTMLAPDALGVLAGYDAIFFGAVGWPTVPDHISLWGLRLAICQGFDQYVCLRPVTLLPGIRSPLVNGTTERIDFVVVRENSEGEYAGVGGRRGKGSGNEIALQTAIFTEVGCERIIRYAFELARTRSKRKVTSVTKSNAQQYGMTLWDDIFNRVRDDYPDVATEQWLVDAMAARFVLHPESVDVVVASNLFGDILSDLGSAIGGSLGIAASANIDPERRKPSMFEPVHGSAPDIAGQGLANPIAAIWSAALMLEHLGLDQSAAQVLQAVRTTTSLGQTTPDLGGTLTTAEAGTAIVAAMG
ncbi:MAG TPA: isocitrate/isopropylmalate family dehydrogenase, partial [Thermomicrobiales bacterium]|nr:isocitrate/isopropylmalate family dehydrogenase [Thermomicrobiales bacterium]